MKTVLKDKDVRNIIADFEIFGEGKIQVIESRGGELSSIEHVAQNRVLPAVADEKEVINSYFYSQDWHKLTEHPPIEIPTFDPEKRQNISIYSISPYSVGNQYFRDPDYKSGLMYCELEERISEFYINHINNGLSFGYIINIPNGDKYSPEEKDEIEKNIRRNLTGSRNAGKLVLAFNGQDVEITVIPLEVNDAHNQWEYLTSEARQQIFTAHRVTSPLLFGVKDNTGLGSNANEYQEAESILTRTVIKPKRKPILNSFEDILQKYGINIKLKFKDVSDVSKVELKKSDLQPVIDSTADYLIDLGEDLELYEGWEVLEERDDYDSGLSESVLNNLTLARVPSGDARKSSEQDTSLFKIRYKYEGSKNPQREFCKKMMAAKKVYRKEDIDKASKQVVNKGFGINGADTYDIFLYKGGVNCQHFWQRVIYMKSNNQKIGVNQARKMILELDPKDRKYARWEQNPKEVAQIASPSNNYWKAN